MKVNIRLVIYLVVFLLWICLNDQIRIYQKSVDVYDKRHRFSGGLALHNAPRHQLSSQGDCVFIKILI